MQSPKHPGSIPDIGPTTNQHPRSDFAARVDRRTVLTGLAAATFLLAERTVWADESQLVDPKTLKPGQFAWHPERAPDGPVIIIVSIPNQWVAVYRNGTRIAVSTCSTGRPGHTTPTGTFIILQKDVNHHSSLYNNAPMPFMERVTWGGVALHAGDLPGYPASHGCVRLPKEFAKLLFGVTHVGTVVIIANHDTVPADVLHPGLLISEHTDELAKAVVAQVKDKPAATPASTTENHQAVSVLISTANKEITVLVNGRLAFKDTVTLRQPELPFGTHVFNLNGPSNDPAKLRWTALNLDGDATLNGNPANAAAASALLFAATIRRVDVPPATAQRLAGLLHPGATMVITDRPTDAPTSPGPGFTIMATDETS